MWSFLAELLIGGDRRTVIVMDDDYRDQRQYRIAPRMFAMTLLVLLVGASILLSYAIFIFIINTEYPSVDEVAQVKERLTIANDQLSEALSKAEDVTRALIDATEAREKELAVLRERYTTLEALVEGQEGIVEAHREILKSRTLKERIVEIGLALFIGVISTLLVSFLLGLRSIRRKASSLPSGDSTT